MSARRATKGTTTTNSSGKASKGGQYIDRVHAKPTGSLATHFDTYESLVHAREILAELDARVRIGRLCMALSVRLPEAERVAVDYSRDGRDFNAHFIKNNGTPVRESVSTLHNPGWQTAQDRELRLALQVCAIDGEHIIEHGLEDHKRFRAERVKAAKEAFDAACEEAASKLTPPPALPNSGYNSGMKRLNNAVFAADISAAIRAVHPDATTIDLTFERPNTGTPQARGGILNHRYMDDEEISAVNEALRNVRMDSCHKYADTVRILDADQIDMGVDFEAALDRVHHAAATLSEAFDRN